MNFSKLYIPLFALLTFSACDIINPEEEIPSYIEILPFEFSPGEDELNSSKITDGWIYVNGEYIGAFDLPKTIPVLAEGELNIIIDPGIKENGINDTPFIYPFYERFTTSANLVRGEVITIQPTTTYDTNISDFIFIEDFEGNDNKFTSEIENTTTNPGEGGSSGFITLDKDDLPSTTAYSIILEELPPINNITYLEVDYNSDVPIFFGVVGFDVLGQQTVSEVDFGVNAKDEWNKVYFNYTDLISQLQQNNTARFQIRISTQIPLLNGEFILENAEIRLDNIKLISFEN